MLAERFAPVPIAAIYSSPSRRALQTIEGLADRRRLRPIVLADLRERELSAATAAEFERAVAATWRDPDRPHTGGESNRTAAARGTAVVRQMVEAHRGKHVMLSTHGSLLAIVLNGFDDAFGYEFWRTLTFPDVYALSFRDGLFAGARRVWDQ